MVLAQFLLGDFDLLPQNEITFFVKLVPPLELKKKVLDGFVRFEFEGVQKLFFFTEGTENTVN